MIRGAKPLPIALLLFSLRCIGAWTGTGTAGLENGYE